MLTPLDSLEILAIVDNEVDPMSAAPPIVSASGRLGDVALTKGRDKSPSGGETVKEIALDQLCCGAHGLSLMITAHANFHPQTILFDTGPTESIFTSNCNRLSPPLQDVSLIHLSHWHRDHSGGTLAAIRIINEAKASTTNSTPLTIDLHPNRPSNRGIRTPAGIIALEPDPAFASISEAGAKINKHDSTHSVLDSYFLISGEIPRVTPYEHGFRRGVRFENEQWVDDELIMDERFVLCHVKDKGLVLFTGCSHAGMINCAKHALSITNNTLPLYAIVGGYHLADASSEQRASTISALKEMDVKLLMAGHCTGWRAKFEIEREMPGALVPSFVGIKTVI